MFLLNRSSTILLSASILLLFCLANPQSVNAAQNQASSDAQLNKKQLMNDDPPKDKLDIQEMWLKPLEKLSKDDKETADRMSKDIFESRMKLACNGGGEIKNSEGKIIRKVNAKTCVPNKQIVAGFSMLVAEAWLVTIVGIVLMFCCCKARGVVDEGKPEKTHV